MMQAGILKIKWDAFPVSAQFCSKTEAAYNTAETALTTRTFTMPAANITISATFTATHLGTKDRPNAVGDIVFNDGTLAFCISQKSAVKSFFNK